MHGPTCVFCANLTPFSLKAVRSTVERAKMVYNAFWFTTKTSDTFPLFEESELRKFVREMCLEECESAHFAHKLH